MKKLTKNYEAPTDPMGEAIMSAIKLARYKKVLHFSMQSPEKEKENSDLFTHEAHLPREGYYSEDIIGYTLPDSFKEYFMTNIAQFMEARSEFGFKTAFTFLNLSLPWTQWLWTLNSSHNCGYDILEEEFRKKKTTPAQKKKFHDELAANVKLVTEDQKINYLNKHYTRLSDSFWVNANDYSDFVYNHLSKPYALKDGWSLAQVEEIMQEWADLVIKEPIKVKHLVAKLGDL